jgi:hypothetical protein
METFLWRYTHRHDGRLTADDHVVEIEAPRIFPDAQRVEASQVVAFNGHASHPLNSAGLTIDV